MPLHFRGVVNAILDWLASLPKTELDSRPSLWVRYARLSMVTGQTTGVEEKLQAAEAAIDCLPARRRTGRQDPRPDWANCRRQG